MRKATFAGVPRSEFRYVTGEDAIRTYASSATHDRMFCGECGSVLFFATDGSDRISITAGTLDAPTGLKTAAHIFIADKGDYYVLDDGAQLHEKGGDKVPMPLKTP